MEHQDWEPVVVRKTTAQLRKEKSRNAPRQTVTKFDAGANKQTGSGNNSRRLDDEFIPKKKTTNPNLRNEVRDARVAKGWKQKDLAHRANVKAHVISEIEQGKRPLPTNLARIGRALGVQFKLNA